MNSENKEETRGTGPTGVPPLKQLYFYLTEGCNLACRHCWLAPKLDPTGFRYPTLGPDLFEKAIQEAKPLGLQGVKLTGGEPLLHPHFKRLLKIVRREELSLTLETNGLLCTSDTAREIAQSAKRFVSVSLDGIDAATHEWVRGLPGSFDGARRAIKNLRNAGIRPQIIFTVMRGNAHQVEGMISLAEEMGAGSVKFNLVQPTARGEKLHQDPEKLTVRELIELGRYVEHELAPRTGLRVHYDFPQAFRSLSRIAGNGGSGLCGILGILGILADGSYALCGIGEQVPDLVFGRIGEDPLEKVWRENVVLNTLRQKLPEGLGGLCSRCLMKGRCLGACVAQNYYSSGKLFDSFWFCQQAEEAGLFPASRLRTKTR